MGIRDELHAAFDGQAFSGEALLARVAVQLDASPRARNHHWATAIAVLLTITLVATLLVVRAERGSRGAQNQGGPINKCLPAHKTSPSGEGHRSITEYTVPADLAG